MHVAGRVDPVEDTGEGWAERSSTRIRLCRMPCLSNSHREGGSVQDADHNPSHLLLEGCIVVHCRNRLLLSGGVEPLTHSRVLLVVPSQT